MAIDPATLAALGQMGGGVLGNIFGDDGDEEREAALRLLRDTNAETGEVAPDMRRSMTSAVDYLRDLYAEGGLDPQSRAALGEAQQSNAARERMGRGAIKQDAAMRGTGGSGVDVAAQLANQQSAANRNASTGARVAADARSRAIDALKGSASIAGGVRGQDSALATFNAAQRLRKAGMMSGTLTGNAAASDQGGADKRFDFGQLGGFLGAGLSGLSSKKRDDEPELLNRPYEE
jgi:hypothetical protein